MQSTAWKALFSRVPREHHEIMMVVTTIGIEINVKSIQLLEPDYVSGHMQSLNMLIVTEGRERSVAEYEALLLAAGFSKVDSRHTGAPLDAILAIK